VAELRRSPSSAKMGMAPFLGPRNVAAEVWGLVSPTIPITYYRTLSKTAHPYVPPKITCFPKRPTSQISQTT
jgi:hypothetical protein